MPGRRSRSRPSRRNRARRRSTGWWTVRSTSKAWCSGATRPSCGTAATTATSPTTNAWSSTSSPAPTRSRRSARTRSTPRSCRSISARARTGSATGSAWRSGRRAASTRSSSISATIRCRSSGSFAVRRAMARAIDQKRIVATVFAGETLPQYGFVATARTDQLPPETPQRREPARLRPGGGARGTRRGRLACRPGRHPRA